jgi:competence protein ComFC
MITSLALDFWSGLLDLIYPPRCLVCGASDEDYLCADCEEKIDVIGSQYCHKCAMPCESYICSDCRKRVYAFDSACSAGVYEGVLSKAIQALKFNFHIGMAEPLAKLMIRCFPYNQFSGKVDMLIPIPIHRSRMVDRGFNQSAELSKLMCERIALPVELRVLYKVKNTRHQANLPQDKRISNLEGAFAVRNPEMILGKSVLLVDDVFTTGSTLNEAAKVLKEAGAKAVHAYTLARTI